MKKGKRHRQKVDKSQNYYYHVPALLVLIAFIQIYLAHFSTLSPWKGGGFGMFAVVDAPDMRFLNVQALDQDGNPLLIEVESYLAPRRKRFMHSIPTQQQLNQLADDLMELDYLPAGSPTLSAIHRFREQNPDIVIPTSMRQQEDWPIYRVKKATDPELLGENPRRIKALRVRFWRLRFDARTHRVYSEPLLKSIERGRWQ